MRMAGARVGVGEVLGAHRALAAVGPEAAREALRLALCSSRRDQGIFDAAWLELSGEPVGVEQTLADLLAQAAAALPRTGVPSREATVPGLAEAAPDAVPAAWSDAELLLHKDFAAYTDAERAAARVLLARLAARGPQRRSRRTRAARRRGRVHDMRGTLRAS